MSQECMNYNYNYNYDLKNMIRSFLFQMRNKIEQDLFLMNELSIN